MDEAQGQRSRIHPRITPMLWFDTEAEEAAQFYTSVFPNSRITQVSRYGKGAPAPEGTVMVVSFDLDGQAFTALNGGPRYTFNEAISLVISCEDQPEVDHYWEGLIAGGGRAVACGWLRDRYGLAWQVVPVDVFDMIADPDPERASRATAAVWSMVKLDVDAIRKAYRG